MIESAERLKAAADELDGLSKSLIVVEKELGKLEVSYRLAVEDFKVALFKASQETGERMPAEDVRNALAHKHFRDHDEDAYTRYLMLRQARERAKGRISDLREIVAAHRSLVSAAKTELEASEGPQPQWTP